MSEHRAQSLRQSQSVLPVTDVVTGSDQRGDQTFVRSSACNEFNELWIFFSSETEVAFQGCLKYN